MCTLIHNYLSSKEEAALVGQEKKMEINILVIALQIFIKLNI